MKATKPKPEDETQAPARRAGRRPKGADGAPALSRDAVVQCAIGLARREPLTELSMVRVAREMAVAPGLIHYYIGSRDDLLSAVINFAFKERMEALPPLVGAWRTDLQTASRRVVEVTAAWPGLGTYILTNNRFRLFQRVEPGETDYGLTFFDHIGRILRDAGFTTAQAALAYHLLMLFISSISAEVEKRLAPGTHHDYIVGYVSRFEREALPGATYLVSSFAKLDTATTFEAGLQLLLDGFETWLPPAKVAANVRKLKRDGPPR
ncbi:MAG TPA: TetR/AcrR family transcriptional regulator C-terminal domain-containing protein [Methylibium sp.]|nr:TetR/AcrR family transcriptional regulator C-terminal domain-containing protein [Methylibium sp.]